MLKAGSVMEWKGCHFENCRLALGVVFCRVNPLGLAIGRKWMEYEQVECDLSRFLRVLLA